VCMCVCVCACTRVHFTFTFYIFSQKFLCDVVGLFREKNFGQSMKTEEPCGASLVITILGVM